MKKNVLSGIVFILAIVLAIAVYYFVFDKYDRVWLETLPMMYLIMVTFASGLGIYISAVLLEIRKTEIENV
jgi:uncharacterized membrane protein